MRYALLQSTLRRNFGTVLPELLPSNYRVLVDATDKVVIEGDDRQGAMLEEDILPMLAKNLIFGEPIHDTHEVLQSIPKTAATLSIGSCIFSVLVSVRDDGPHVEVVGRNCGLYRTDDGSFRLEYRGEPT